MFTSIIDSISSLRIQSGKEENYGNLNITGSYSSRIAFNASSLTIQPIKVSSVKFRFYCYNTNGSMQISIAEANSLAPISNNYQVCTPFAKYDGTTYNEVSLEGQVLNEAKQRIENGDTFSIFLYKNSQHPDIGIYPYGRGKNYKLQLIIEWQYSTSTGSLTYSTLDLEQEQVLKIETKDSSYYHKVLWYINNEVESLNSDAPFIQTTSSSYKYSKDLINKFASNSKTIPAKVKLITYDSKKEPLGEKEYSFTLKIPDSLGCPTGLTCSFSPSYTINTNNVFNNSGLYIVNYTKIIWVGSATAATGANIINYKITFSGGASGEYNSSKSEGQLGPLVSKNSIINYTITATDSRGFSLEYKNTITPTQYNKPSIVKINAFRSNSTGAISAVHGTYTNLTVKHNFTSLGGKNSITSYVIKGTTQGIERQINTIPTQNNNTYNMGPFSSNEIVFTMSVTDAAGFTSDVTTFTIPAAKYILHIPKKGNGIGIGTYYSQANNYIDCGWTLNLQKGFKMGELDFSSVTTQEGFQKNIGGPFLPTAGGTVTGEIKLAYDTNKTSKARITAGSQTLLAYKYSSYENGTLIATHTAPTAIRGSELKYLKEISENSFVAYDIYHQGNIIYSKDPPFDPPLDPEEEEEKKGTIWLCPVD